MDRDQPSRTLLKPVIMRAAHQVLDRPVIFEDPISIGLVLDSEETAIRSRAVEYLAARSALLRSVFVQRSRFTEDRLARAVREGVRQYVVLGAGLETFPWRQPPWARDLQIFYLDHPASMREVSRIRAGHNLSPPNNLVTVACDLEREPVADVLCASGLDPKQPVFFSLLGLTQYLTSTTVERVFRALAGFVRGTHIACTYAPPQDMLQGEDAVEAAAAVARSDALGEPWLFRPRPNDLARMLTQSGFESVRLFPPSAVQATYFSGRTDLLRASGIEQLAEAFR
jgi:methyltransferase (TIGR00027 family)